MKLFEFFFFCRKPRFLQPVTSTPTSARFKIPKMPLKPFSKKPVVESENISRRRVADLAASAAISHSQPRLGCGDRDFLASLSQNFPSYRSHPEAEIFRNDFKRNRETLVTKLFKIFNENVFEKKVKYYFCTKLY